MLTIGCHLSASKGYLAMARDAVSIDANTFQFFTRNPRGGKAKDIDPADVEAFHACCAEHGITTILAHAPYTLNAAAAKPEVQEFARATFADDLVRMEATPHQMYNFHPGSHVGQGAQVGIEKIASVLNEVLTPEQTTTVLLETMAGKGTEIGRTFEELSAIIDREELKSGDWGKVSINFFPFAASGNNGIGVGINNIMKTRDGIALGGTPASAEDDFEGEFEDEDGLLD